MKSILQDSFKPTDTLSMVDLLQAEKDNEIQAQHLSTKCGKNLNKCTYSKGYINQPVFACLTCLNNNNNNSNNSNNDNNNSLISMSGICLGCSMNCHLEHNIIELWNKRNFKCDCGNNKYNNSSQKDCLLSCEKDSINLLNNYNHNFIGQYCYCNREYHSSEDTMHQCLNCQDWFHQTCIILYHLKINKHLKQKYDSQKQLQNTNNNQNNDQFFDYFRKLLIPNSDSFICKNCAVKYDYFFVNYRWKMDINNASLPKAKICGLKRNFSDMSSDSINNNDLKRRKLNNEMKQNENEINCKRLLLNKNEMENIIETIGGGLWFENDWINKLCQCEKCNDNIYNKYGLKWLIEDDNSGGDGSDGDNDDDDINGSVYDLNIPKQELKKEFSTDAMIAESINKLPRQNTLDALNIMLKGTDIIKQKLFDYIKLNPTKQIIDQNDIHNIFKT